MPFKNHLILKLSCTILAYSLFDLPASSASLDFTSSVIVTAPKLERLEHKAVTVLREEIHKRTGIQYFEPDKKQALGRYLGQAAYLH